MFKMIQSNHKGSSATGKRGREVSSGGKKTSVMRLKQNADKQKRQSRGGQTEKERESLKKCYPLTLSIFLMQILIIN